MRHQVGVDSAMRRFLVSNAQVFQRLENLEYKQIATDQKVKKLVCLHEVHSWPNAG